MADISRIKFNPVTKEFEIEGSEAFVKTYFEKIQELLGGGENKTAKVPAKEKPVKVVKEKPIKEKPVKKEKIKKAPKSKQEKAPTIEGKKGNKMSAVLGLILESTEGITTTELEEKTGLKDKQIWAIINRAVKMGKIRKVKRGVYAG